MIFAFLCHTDRRIRFVSSASWMVVPWNRHFAFAVLTKVTTRGYTRTVLNVSKCPVKSSSKSNTHAVTQILGNSLCPLRTGVSIFLGNAVFGCAFNLPLGRLLCSLFRIAVIELNLTCCLVSIGFREISLGSLDFVSGFREISFALTVTFWVDNCLLEIRQLLKAHAHFLPTGGWWVSSVGDSSAYDNKFVHV